MERFDLSRIIETALGVFIGALAALMLMDALHSQKETSLTETAKTAAETRTVPKRQGSEISQGPGRNAAPPALKAPPSTMAGTGEPDPDDSDADEDLGTDGGTGSQSQDEDIEELGDEDSEPGQQ